jgi:hypothetical protein
VDADADCAASSPEVSTPERPRAIRVVVADDATEVISCPLCGLAHRVGAATCDGCGQPLNKPVDLGQIRAEHAARKRDMVLAGGAVFALIVANLLFFGGGAFVIVSAPLAWLAWTWLRLRALSKRLDRLAS